MEFILYRKFQETVIVLGIPIITTPTHYRVVLGWWYLDIGRSGLWFKYKRWWTHPLVKRENKRLRDEYEKAKREIDAQR